MKSTTCSITRLARSTETTLQFFKDVQTAIWLLVGDTHTDFPVTANAENMIKAAKAHPNYVPAVGDIVAIIIYSDGGIVNPPPTGHIQQSIFELKRIGLGSIVNKATGSGEFNQVVVESAQVKVTVTQTVNSSW